MRARLVALSRLPEEWAEVVRALRIDGEDEYLTLQTVVGAWPLEAERLDSYLVKALREGKWASSWLRPDEAAERRIQALGRRLLEEPRVAVFLERLRPLGEQISLGMTLLKLTAPGVPDVYQGDELEYLALVDPDNRRPVDWELRRRALADPPPKLRMIRDVLRLGIEGDYEPVDAGSGVCAYRRGDSVLVAVPIRPGARFEPPPGWCDLLGEDLPVQLLERGQL